MTTRVFGIRHHGPGSSRSLAASLDAWQPDAVLIEGPAEATPLLRLAGSPGMVPPVALLAYLPAAPAKAAFWPFAAFSPEWVALRWAAGAGVEAQMVDLPAGVVLSGEADERRSVASDPLGTLAAAAGYEDAETWWEDVVEHRLGEEPWEAVTEAMAELRSGIETPPRERAREASMRQAIRAAERKSERVAVVCGAWHAPVLVDRPSVKDDREALSGLKKEKVAVTWVPWSDTRLSFSSGYGAGVTSPGWYAHLFGAPDRPVTRWLSRVASLLRGEGLDASPASVVEAVRLAEVLAVLRGRPLAGLAECTDAAQAVLAGGAAPPLMLIHRRLVVGEGLGEVPEEAPTVPLAADLAAASRRLRLKPEAVERHLDLDLRGDNDLARSHLLHRLSVLRIPWGELAEDPVGTGTFRESWDISWEPELSIRVVEASVYGTTVAAAATARAVEVAGDSGRVGDLVAIVGDCLLADLPDALGPVMAALEAAAAAAADVGDLMDAVPTLARAARYGSVRRSDTAAVARVVAGMVTRVVAGLSAAAASLDDEAAAVFARRLAATSAALGDLADAGLRERWQAALVALSSAPALHGLVGGRATRLVADAGLVPAEEVARRLSAALSVGEDPLRGAAWLAGLLAGSGLLLVHDATLLGIVDGWLETVQGGRFDDVLPLLRRAFADFEAAERRMLADAVAALDGSGPRPGGGPELLVDEAAGLAVLPAVAELLGLEVS